jgi:hypothetical protein
MLEYIINTVYSSIAFVSSYFIEDNNVLCSLIALDTVFTSIASIGDYYSSNSGKYLQKYKLSWIDRYLIYATSYLIYLFSEYILWKSDLPIQQLLLFLSVPNILQNVSNNIIFLNVIKVKNQIFINVISSVIISLLEYIILSTLHKKVIIDSSLVTYLIDKTKKSYNILLTAIFNISIVIILYLIKNISKKYVYYKAIKLLYQYKYEEKLESFNYQSSKEKIINTIENKQWDNLISPNFYRAIIETITLENNNKKFNFQLFDFLARIGSIIGIWTLIEYNKSILLLIPIRLIGAIFRKTNTKTETSFLFVLTGFLFLLPEQYLLISFTSQFYDWVLSSASQNIIILSIKKLKNKSIDFFQKSIYQKILQIDPKIFFGYLLIISLVNDYVFLIDTKQFQLVIYFSYYYFNRNSDLFLLVITYLISGISYWNTFHSTISYLLTSYLVTLYKKTIHNSSKERLNIVLNNSIYKIKDTIQYKNISSIEIISNYTQYK